MSDQCTVLTKCPICSNINEHNVRQKEADFAYKLYDLQELILAPCISCRRYRSQSVIRGVGR